MLVLGRDEVAELDRCAPVEARVGLLVVLGPAIGVRGWVFEVARWGVGLGGGGGGGGRVSDAGGGGEGAEEGAEVGGFGEGHC